jgi:protein-S-isoprenylcysteine O-methyltransferase Ste14
LKAFLYGSPSAENGRSMSSHGKKIAEFLNSHRKAWEYSCNTILGVSNLFFDLGMLADFQRTHRISSLLLCVFETVIVFFAFTRPLPKELNTSLYDWTIALAGTLIVMAMRPATQVHDNVLIIAVQLFGMAISMSALLSLNKSFGLVAANRGVKTRGMYGVIRHPIYAGYFLSSGAFLIQNMTALNALIYVVFVTMELLRLVAEERVLSRDPDYAAYLRKTRWRVLPLIY